MDRSDQLEGYTVNFTSIREDIDLTVRYADREEVFEAGDAFYTPPGHIPVKHEPGTEVVIFSPAEELRKTEAVMSAGSGWARVTSPGRRQAAVAAVRSCGVEQVVVRGDEAPFGSAGRDAAA